MKNYRAGHKLHLQTDEYNKQFSKGEKYENYIYKYLLDKFNIMIEHLNTEELQHFGENLNGLEIKFDDRMKNTGNIYIEYAEKRKSSNKNWVDSGILKSDNTKYILIGNYTEFFLFKKTDLQEMYSIVDMLDIQLVETGTSKGFLIKKDKANKIAKHILI